MYYRAIGGALAAITVGANAFLLPPGMNSVESAAGIATFDNPSTQAIKLPCPDCVFSRVDETAAGTENEDHLFWAQGGARAVVVNFTLSDDMRAVKVNDWQIYPLSMDTLTKPTVSEVAATASLHNSEQANVLDVTSSSSVINEESVTPTGDKIVKVQYQVLSLSGQPITVDGAEVTLFESADGTLVIISVEAITRTPSPFDSSPFKPEGPTKECGKLPATLCKWKSMVESKIGGFRQGLPHGRGGKGCGGRRPHKLPGHIRPHIDHLEKPGNEERPKHHHGRPPHPDAPHGMHRGGPHHHHHHPHRPHVFPNFVRAFVSVLVPIIAGITMGMFVSLVGMATGRLISFLWIKFRRGGQRGYASVAQAEADDQTMEKGAVEVINEEPLPEYEAAPAYEENEQK